MDAYYLAWRFWGDGEFVFAMTFAELDQALAQAERIARAEARAAQ